ncbi:MFS transporter asaE [Pseudocercospora fuligena]|uniref:MFS transporter asaE n=1 Tax=Pseudocercospora fuligena TaxID=685502 RepID=A0A8H6RIJ1_9PEZI|nr:MFS transporter asaE [Pseudocercospora fuligena]
MATATESTIELTAIHHRNAASGTINDDNIEQASDLNAQSLPPVDGGWQAWTFLSACFALEAIAWGLPFSFGIFQTHYQANSLFNTSTSSLAAIGTTTIGVSYFSSPFVGIFLQTFPRTRRPCMLVGLTIMCTALIGASNSSTTSLLILTQGALYGLGTILLYYPSNLFLDEWFVARKGLAYGIMFAGTGFAGVIVPFILEWLLNTYSFRTTLRIWTIVTFILTLPCINFIRPRLPPSTSSALRPRDLLFVRNKIFWLFQFGNTIQSLGVFIPSLWMPTFALSINLPSYAGPLSLAFYNGAYSIGNICGGHLTDKFHVSTVIGISTLGAMLGTFVFWGLAQGQAMLYIFAILWGSCSGIFNIAWTGCARVVGRKTSPNGVIDTGIYIGIMAAGKGIGGVVSGPLSEKLLEIGWRSSADFVYGSMFAPLVIFCGISAAFGGSACVGRLLKMF